MENRRTFLKKAGILAGSFGVLQHLPKSIEAALAIEPRVGSSFLDAEHIVMLMQENRSFDHSFGTLKGVRGFNDPRAIRLSNGNPVWLQSNNKGQTFAPFRLDIKNSKASWTSYLPHSWENQIGAWNKGKFDQWLDWKSSDYKEFSGIPLTLGYYTREDIPFYYALADAFTICDQHFCSSMTGTTTNRHFFWTGKCIPDKNDRPLVRNSDVYFDKVAYWKTFPERLQEQGVSWKVYQNEISLQNEISGSNESLLGNFTDNNLEWFAKYNVRFKQSHIDFYQKRIKELPQEIRDVEAKLINEGNQKLRNILSQKQNQLISFQKEVDKYNTEQFDKLSDFEKELHKRAFQTNEENPNYHEVEEVDFEGEKITIPKGDILYQFRKDVDSGQLPTVSWLCAPQVFSDHPSAPMYGAWYVSEVLSILTKNPEVWKKTIFILNYDENDGYFDHVPPFVAPNINDKSSGNVTDDLWEGLETEYVTREQELVSGQSETNATAGPVGLGYRVPLIVASPWTKGGWVNSEIFDLTSTIQFIETFIQNKFKKNIFEENISPWRRAISGDLTSVFRAYDNNGLIEIPEFLNMKHQIVAINRARSKPLPDNYINLSRLDIEDIKSGKKDEFLPRQEIGTKPSNALNYELDVIEKHTDSQVELVFVASNYQFGKRSLAGVFTVYDRVNPDHFSQSFAVSAGKTLSHKWEKRNGTYDLEVHGPNGFYRHYISFKKKENLVVSIFLNSRSDNILLKMLNNDNHVQVVEIKDAYANETEKVSVKAGKVYSKVIDNSKSGRWYDISICCEEWERQFAGRVENGKHSITDPLMA